MKDKFFFHRRQNGTIAFSLLLDDGSPTSANLGNDHGFINEEY